MEIQEKDLLLDRSYTCPLCGASFKAKSVKTGVAKLIDTEMDLRPRYHNIDVLKYDVVLCPECGYTALAKYFPTLNSAQKNNVEKKVAANYKKRDIPQDYYDYDCAVERYKMALINTMVKISEISEIGYVCLKLSWLLQNRRDSINGTTPEALAEKGKYDKMAMSYTKEALKYLMQARMEEDYPICGMDEATLDYLLAALATMDEQLDVASRMLSTVTSSREASDRLKNKAFDLKQLISQKQKAAEKLENE